MRVGWKAGWRLMREDGLRDRSFILWQVEWGWAWLAACSQDLHRSIIGRRYLIRYHSSGQANNVRTNRRSMSIVLWLMVCLAYSICHNSQSFSCSRMCRAKRLERGYLPGHVITVKDILQRMLTLGLDTWKHRSTRIPQKVTVWRAVSCWLCIGYTTWTVACWPQALLWLPARCAAKI